LLGVAVVGSYARRAADAHSDLDLVLVVDDAGYESFLADRDSFLAAVGEPLFIESWEHRDRWFFIFAGGGDGDLTVIPAAQLATAFDASFVPLLDKCGVFDGIVATSRPPAVLDGAARGEIQRRLTGFWHDYTHFVTAWSRGQWWWANGQLEVLRGMCANLLRLANDPTDPEVGDEPYWKIELTLSDGELARLAPSLNTLEPASMLATAQSLASLYSEIGHELAVAHGLTYPEELERTVLSRLDKPER
jgi:hypothetical protein